MSILLTTHQAYAPQYELLVGMVVNFETGGEFVVAEGRNHIKKFEQGSTVFNVKKFKTPNIFQSLVYRFLRKGKARRSYEYGLRLLDMGINTPTPVAYAERFSLGLKESYYISEHLDYDFDFRTLNHNPRFPNREEILKQMAAFTFKMHEKGVNFLDHSPGNTLIKDQGDGTYGFYLIDLNRMQFGAMNFEQRMRNFRRLWLSKTMIKVMSKEYARLYGTSEKATHELMTRYSRAFQKKVNSKKLRRRKRAR